MNTLLMTRRWLVAAPCAMSLASCSLLPDPPTPQMYRLRPTDLDPTDTAVHRGNLAVETPTAPENLDSDRIALSRGVTQFAYFADCSWTDRVPALLQTLLVEAFETNGKIADVWTDPDTMSTGYLLQTQVRAFTARYDDAADHPPVAEVSLDLRLVRLPGHATVGRTLIAAQSPATQNKVNNVVQAFDIATGDALNRCVAWTLKVMQG